MANVKAEFEMTDKEGTTVMYAGAVGTAGANIPSVAGKYIDEIGIRCAVDQANNRRLEFSFDAGTTWHRLRVGEWRETEPRGTITQVRLRAAGTGVTTVNYEVEINYGRLP